MSTWIVLLTVSAVVSALAHTPAFEVARECRTDGRDAPASARRSIQAHRATRDEGAAIYASTATKSGPSLKPSDASIDCSVVTPNPMPHCHVVRSGMRGLQGDRVDMNDLVLAFRQLLGQPVLDKTV